MSDNGGLTGTESPSREGIELSIATKLIVSFLLIIFVTSAFFSFVSVSAISNHIRADSEEQAEEFLANAREVFLDRLNHVNSVVYSTGQRLLVREALQSGQMDRLAEELNGIRILETLDILTVTDRYGSVLFRATNPDVSGDSKDSDELIQEVMRYRMPAAATAIVNTEDLARESPVLAEKARAAFADSPELRVASASEDFENMMLAAASPIFGSQSDFIGMVYGGILLNGNQGFACDLKQAVFNSSKYNGKDTGFVTLYQDGLAIASCPRIASGPGAIGTVLSGDAYTEAVESGRVGKGREEVMDSWYVTAFQPIRNADFETVGVLQIGTLEQRYLDIRNNIVVSSLAITLGVALAAALFAYFISRRISVPLKKIVIASRAVARGDLAARVDTRSAANDELGELGEAFNAMAAALQERDAQLKEMARSRIQRSERLAMIGKLSASVAHELNNPLQGIVTYSHLLRERLSADDPGVNFVDVIVTQSDRCREIIRGLLDFARQREPHKVLCDVNVVLLEAIALLENQALFHNVTIERDFDGALPQVVIDPSQIERVFMNIIVNAAEAMDGNGRLILSTRYDAHEQHINVLFEDSGRGIAEEDQRRIFDPFFTTKEVGRGTGLGLAISYGIVQEHGGTILVSSVIGHGTTFVVQLPVTTEPGHSGNPEKRVNGARSPKPERVRE
jgi:two-component system NtrC family sensor kinase